MARKTSSKGAKSQSQKFIEAARATGCDEDEAAFEEQLKKIAKAKALAPERTKPHRKRG